MPNAARWRTDQAEKWAAGLRGVSERTRNDYREKVEWALERFTQAGFRETPLALPAAAVESLCRDTALCPTTRNGVMYRLRRFLKWAGNPIAEDRDLWRAPKWVASRRRWATMGEIVAMLAHARDDAARAAIALAGTCGLRRDEIVRLTVGMIQPDGTGGYRLDFRGKFDKPRHVRLTDTARDALLPLIAGKGPSEKVYPWQRARVNLDFQLASRAAGGRDLSPHDLRRGFGREFLRAFGHSARALAALRDIYGHEDVSETIYYVGLDQEAADEGMLAFSESVRRAQLAVAV